MSSPVLGIDLGTTNSVVAYADESRVRVLRDEDGRLLTPSTVSFLESGETWVGHAARDLRLVDAQNTIFSVKRLIGRPFRSAEVRLAAERLPFKLEEGPTGGVVVRVRNETYSLPEVASYILRRVRAIAERVLREPCVNAVITVPANFNELQRMATRDAGRIAGLNVLRILNEPTAAALAYGYRARQQQRIAVYDFGGGTFDISILELSGDVIEVVATAGDTHLGGDDLDRAVAERMVGEFARQHGVDLMQQPQAYERVVMAAEWIKCQLSELEAAEATIKELAVVNGKSLDLKFRLNRNELYALCSPLIARTFSICEDAFRSAGVRPSQLDSVILVGGQTRTPRVRDMVSDYFGMVPKSSVDPDLAVAQGAALQGYALSGAPGIDLERRAARTLAGAASVPPSAADEDIFEDEPTHIAAPHDLRQAQRGDANDSPFGDMPTVISQQDDDVERSRTGDMRAPHASIRPQGALGTHATTLAGVGMSPTAGVKPVASPPQPEPVTVSNEGTPFQDDLLLLSSAELKPNRTLAETPYAKAGQRPSRAPGARASAPPPARSAGALPPATGAASPSAVPVVRGPTAPTVPRTSAPRRKDSTVPDEPVSEQQDLPAALRTPRSAAESEDDVTSTLLETPKAKAKTRPPRAAAASESSPGFFPVAEPQQPEPTGTHATARQLAAAGQYDAALALYGELLSRRPNEPVFLSEARALRARAAAAAAPAAVAAPTEAGPAAGAAAGGNAAAGAGARSDAASADAAARGSAAAGAGARGDAASADAAARGNASATDLPALRAGVPPAAPLSARQGTAPMSYALHGQEALGIPASGPPDAATRGGASVGDDSDAAARRGVATYPSAHASAPSPGRPAGSTRQATAQLSYTTHGQEALGVPASDLPDAPNTAERGNPVGGAPGARATAAQGAARATLPGGSPRSGTASSLPGSSPQDQPSDWPADAASTSARPSGPAKPVRASPPPPPAPRSRRNTGASSQPIAVVVPPSAAADDPSWENAELADDSWSIPDPGDDAIASGERTFSVQRTAAGTPYVSPSTAPLVSTVMSQFPAPPGAAPLLLDVTPHTLCVETVGGFCEQLIERNAPIPTEQTRSFSTSRDDQTSVSVRICQGESRRTDDNQVLGQIELLSLRKARRGEVSIAVTFVIDADGTLNVRAIDEDTGHGQEIRVSLVGAIEPVEIERMRARLRTG